MMTGDYDAECLTDRVIRCESPQFGKRACTFGYNQNDGCDPCYIFFKRK